MTPTATDFIATLARLQRTEKTEGLKKELKTCHFGDKAVLVMTSELDLDTDGFTDGAATMDKTHQSDTSLHWPHGSPVNSNLTRYVVIPGRGWGARHRIQTGDVGLAQLGTRREVVGVIVADIGPPDKIGEGSLALHRAFGHECLINGRIHDEGMPGIFRMLLFPGSSRGCCLSNDAAETLAWKQFRALLDSVPSPGDPGGES